MPRSPQGQVLARQCRLEANGYIQSVDYEALLRLARDRKTIVRMERGIGGFVVHKAPAGVARSGTLRRIERPSSALNAAYGISRHRTVDQDPAFGIRQIVDMALKALSPGINDTSTAVMCVDYLTAILARLAPADDSLHRAATRKANCA